MRINLNVSIVGRDGGSVAAALYSAAMSGLSSGDAVNGDIITGSITGLVGGETVVHAWQTLTDIGQGYEDVTGEASSTITIAIGNPDIADGAPIRYAPFIDGVQYFSSAANITQAAPAFTSQPTITGTPTIGNTLTMNIGAASNGGSLSIATFTLAGVDKSGELVDEGGGDYSWDTTGESAGAISFTVEAANSHSSSPVTSNTITDTLAAASVSATVTPVVSTLYETQALNAISQYSTFASPSNYTGASGTVTVTPRAEIDGVSAAVTDTVVEGDAYELFFDVYDDAVFVQTFSTGSDVAEYYYDVTTTAANVFNIDVNTLVDDAVVLPTITIDSTDYTGITAADTRGGPFLLDAEPSLVYVDLTDGDTVTVDSGNWLSSTGSLTLTEDILVDSVSVGTPYDIVTSTDGGDDIQAEVDADDGVNSVVTETSTAVTVPGGDVTAPTLSSATDAANGSTASTASVSTNEGNGTLYWVVTTSGTAPTAAQVKLGQDNSGTAATDSGSQSVSGTGVQTVTPAPSGLTASTAYTTHFMHEDAATNQSSVASASGFTTAGAGATYGDIVAVDMASGTNIGSGTAGVVSTDGWVVKTGTSWSDSDINDVTGTGTGMTVALANGAGQNTGRITGSGDLYNLLERGVRIDNSPETTLTFTSIPWSKWDLIVYITEDGGSGSSSDTTISDGTTTYYIAPALASKAAALEQITNTTGTSPATTGTYALFDGGTASSVTITFDRTGGNLTHTVAGFQIVERTD